MKRNSLVYLISLCSLIWILSGCAMMQRHPSSGYGHGTMTDTTLPEEVSIYDQRYQAPPIQSQLQSPNYQRNGISVKSRYTSKAGSRVPASLMPKSYKQFIDNHDIAVGMSMKDVKESWGEPQVVEISGHPSQGNQRWQYSEFMPTPDGYNREDRIIYFENGQVAGWDKR